MSYSLLKDVAKRIGVYPQARRLYRSLAPAQSRHFKRECALYAPLISRGQLCFDVGANYGAKSEVFTALGARVVAFEPQPDCCRELHDRNPNAITVCAAVGSTPGIATLYVDRHRTGSSVVKGWREVVEDTITVPMTTLDAEIKRHGLPAFCKIDVEGFDLEVLKGLTRPLPALSFEFHAHRIPDALACLEYLSNLASWRGNIVGAEATQLAFARWLTLDDIRREFADDRMRSPSFAWGDVLLTCDNQISNVDT